jgi:hypothetical protein
MPASLGVVANAAGKIVARAMNVTIVTEQVGMYAKWRQETFAFAFE